MTFDTQKKRTSIENRIIKEPSSSYGNPLMKSNFLSIALFECTLQHFCVVYTVASYHHRNIHQQIFSPAVKTKNLKTLKIKNFLSTARSYLVLVDNIK